VSRKPPELPNIEDAALRDCLAPLMDAMNAGERPRDNAGSNDNPAPANDPAANCFGTPETLAEWKAMADDDFGLFRTIELFLAMTDAELETAAAEFPRQVNGTIARIGGLKRRLSVQYDTVTTVTALLERAMARVAVMTSKAGE
jgi:hypothetical protein